MMSRELIKAGLQKLKWNDADKQLLLGLVEGLGPNGLWYAYREAVASGSQVIAKPLLAALQQLVDADQALRAGDETKLLKILVEAPTSPGWDLGRYAVGAALDIETMITNRRLAVSQQLEEALLNFEAQLFFELYPENVINALRTRLLYFTRHINLVMECKRLFLRKAGFGDEQWLKSASKVVSENEEMLGEKLIIVESKQQKPSIRNWIQDYLTALTVPILQRTTIHEVEYISKSPNLKTLSPSTVHDLQSILHLFVWLQHPQTSREEVEAYENELYSANNGSDSGLKELTTPPPLQSAQAVSIQDILSNKRSGGGLQRGAAIVADTQTQSLPPVPIPRPPASQPVSAKQFPQEQSTQGQPKIMPQDIASELERLRQRKTKQKS